jgi:hypothetical protein
MSEPAAAGGGRDAQRAKAILEQTDVTAGGGRSRPGWRNNDEYDY